jgi:AraC-like DNA-binding protein
VAPIRTAGKDAWSELITSSFIALAVSDAQDDFRGELDHRDLRRGISLTEVKTGRSRVTRTERLAKSDGCDDVLFLVHQEGNGSVAQDRCRKQLSSGYGSLHDARCPYELAFRTTSREIVLQAPKRLFPSGDLVSPLRRSAGVAADLPAMRVFSAFARELLAVADDLTEATREEMGQTTIDLLVSVLRSCEGNELISDTSPYALVLTLQSFIRANLGDPDLTAETVAARHHVSLRYAQRLFAVSGDSPAAFIRAERLKRAQHALRDVRLVGVPIASIAHRAGFRTVDTFIRAFRREFGVTPGDWRRNVASPRSMQHSITT